MLSIDVKQRGAFALAANFAAPTPGITALFGRSGSGKTTPIHMISGLAAPGPGTSASTARCCSIRPRASMSRRSSAASATCSRTRACFRIWVRDNLRYGERRAGGRARSALTRWCSCWAWLRCSRAARASCPAASVSASPSVGRCCPSRALLLLDEPLAALDVARREEVLPYLETLRERLRLPMVYVSHQFEEVLRLATHLVLLDAGRVWRTAR